MAESTESSKATPVARRKPQTKRPRDWRESKWLAVGEFVVVGLIFVADARHLIPFSKTPFLLLFGWISLSVREIGWRRVGLKLYRGWKRSIALAVAAGALLEALELFITQPMLVKWLGKQPDLEVFRALHGNVKWTLIALAGAWTLGAFGEEMVTAAIS